MVKQTKTLRRKFPRASRRKEPWQGFLMGGCLFNYLWGETRAVSLCFCCGASPVSKWGWKGSVWKLWGLGKVVLWLWSLLAWLELQDAELPAHLAGTEVCWKVGDPEVCSEIWCIYMWRWRCVFEFGIALYFLFYELLSSVSVLSGEVGSGESSFFIFLFFFYVSLSMLAILMWMTGFGLWDGFLPSGTAGIDGSKGNRNFCLSLSH